MNKEKYKEEFAEKIKTKKKEASKANLIKFASYIPIVSQIVYGILLKEWVKEGAFFDLVNGKMKEY